MTTPTPFGRLSTAMVTPFKKDLSIDWDGVATLAKHLLSTGHDAIIVNGTTGEAPTTSDDEKDQIIKVVKDAVAGKAKVVAGAGNNETSHSVEQALRAQKAGADGLLVVTPYYNKPPQAGIEAHFRAIADAADLPVMMYDIPGRTGMQIEPDTIVKLSEHPRIVALKDAKGDVAWCGRAPRNRHIVQAQPAQAGWFGTVGWTVVAGGDCHTGTVVGTVA